MEEFCLTYVTILTIIIVTATTLGTIGTRITMLIGTAMNNISDIHHCRYSLQTSYISQQQHVHVVVT